MAGRTIIAVVLLGSAAVAGWYRPDGGVRPEGDHWERVERKEREIPISRLLRASRLPLQTASRQAAR